MKKKQLLSLILGAVCALSTLAFPVKAHASSFADVADDRWSASAVQWANARGIMHGTGDGNFSPEGQMQRGMVVTVLHRMRGLPETVFRSVFSDVPAGEYYSDAVIWAFDNGIVSGTSMTTFSPLDPITREQCAAMLFDLAANSGYDTGARIDLNVFADVSEISPYAAQALSWIASSGIITGTEPGRLSPKGILTREQFAMILMRFEGLLGAMTPASPPVEEPLPEPEPEPVIQTIPYIAPTVHGKYTEVKQSLVKDADYYVDDEGSDANSGTFEKPFRTFDRVIEALIADKNRGKEPITVAFMAGTYNSLALELTDTVSGSRNAPITFCAYGDGDVVFSGGGYYAMIGMYRTSHMVFRGLTFRDARENAIATNESVNLTFENCTFRNLASATGYGLFFTAPEEITVKGCTFHTLGGGGVKLQSEPGSEAYQSLLSSKCVIDNNLFYDYAKASSSYDIAGVYINNVAGTDVTHNEFRDATWCAIRFLAVDTDVEYNYIHGVRLSQKDYGLIYTGRSLVDRGNNIRYNIIADANTGTDIDLETYGVYLDDGIAGQTVSNNLFYNCGNSAVLLSGGKDNRVSDNAVIDTTGTWHAGITANAKYRDYAKRNAMDEMHSWPGLRDSMNRAVNRDTWRSKFPEIYSINMDPSSWQDTNSVVNPSGSSVMNNIFYGTCNLVLQGDAASILTVTDNKEFKLTAEDSVFADPTTGDYTVTGSFTKIPVKEIGRY